MGERGEQKFQTGLRKSRALFPFLGRVCVRREIHQGRKSHTDHLGKQICPADFLYSSMVKGGGMCPKHREREREGCGTEFLPTGGGRVHGGLYGLLIQDHIEAAASQ